MSQITQITNSVISRLFGSSEPKATQEVSPVRVPQFELAVLNDDQNSGEWVSFTLQKALRVHRDTAMRMVMDIHNNGSAVIFTGTAQECHQRAYGIAGCGSDPSRQDQGAEVVRTFVQPKN